MWDGSIDDGLIATRKKVYDR